MSYPDCKVHPGRTAELVCLSNECPKRLSLQCTICISATCKRHNWKLMQEAIEEIFQLCENEESKDQKRMKGETTPPTSSTSTREEVQRLLDEFNKKLKIKQEQIMANADLKAQGLLAKNQTPEKMYVLVKNRINDFRKANDRSMDNLDKILNVIKPLVVDNETGMLMFTYQPSTTGLLTPDVIQLENYLNYLIQGPKLTRAGSFKASSVESPRKESVQNQKELNQLRQHYQSQINGLIQQVKSVPILKSRIEAINMKLQAKDEKLKRYEEGTSASNLIPPSASTGSLKSSQFIDQKCKESETKANRVQKLLAARENVKSMMYQYTYKNQSESISIQRLLWDQDVKIIDIKNVHNESAMYLNQAMVLIADELSYLGYSDKEEGEPSVDVQIISKKSGDYKPSRVFSDRDQFLDDRAFGSSFNSPHLGGRSYFPKYY